MRHVLALVLFTAAGVALAAPVPKELKKSNALDGTWEVVEWVSYGREVNIAATTIQWTIDGETLTIDRRVQNGGARPVPIARPMYKLVRPAGEDASALDYTFNANAAAAARSYPGRVEVSGDTLRFAYSPRGGERPTDVKADKNCIYYEFRRVTKE